LTSRFKLWRALRCFVRPPVVGCSYDAGTCLASGSPHRAITPRSFFSSFPGCVLTDSWSVGIPCRPFMSLIRSSRRLQLNLVWILPRFAQIATTNVVWAWKVAACFIPISYVNRTYLLLHRFADELNHRILGMGCWGCVARCVYSVCADGVSIQ